MKEIRVYGVYGFLGDQLMNPVYDATFNGKKDSYLIADFLSEDTYQILEKLKTDNFFSPFLDNMMSVAVLRTIYYKRMKFICNAGALNAEKCARLLKEKLDRIGIPLKVAFIGGDNLNDSLSAFDGFPSSKTGEKLDLNNPSKIISATVYIGAEKITECLKNGADIVIAGRVTDAGMSLGGIMKELGWEYGKNWDKIATGVVGGHLLSCGGQPVRPVKPGILTVTETARLSYPYIDVREDGYLSMGSATKISEESVLSQLFYGMSSERFIDPDVTVELKDLKIRQTSENCVELYDIKGSDRPEKLRGIALLKTGIYNLTGILQLPLEYTEALSLFDIKEIIRLRIAQGGSVVDPENFRIQLLGKNETDCFIQVHGIFSNKLYANIAKSQVPSLIVSGFNGSYGSVPAIDEEITIWDSFLDRQKVESRLKVGYL